jgi:hypothetical protein
MEISSASTLKLSTVFIFKLCHFKAFDDYIILHNRNMLYSDPVLYTMELLGMWEAFHIQDIFKPFR